MIIHINMKTHTHPFNGSFLTCITQKNRYHVKNLDLVCFILLLYTKVGRGNRQVVHIVVYVAGNDLLSIYNLFII